MWWQSFGYVFLERSGLKSDICFLGRALRLTFSRSFPFLFELVPRPPSCPFLPSPLCVTLAQTIHSALLSHHLSTHLLSRWLTLYPPLPTFLRLLSLQSICWLATSITLGVMGQSRPLMGWVVVCCATSFWVGVGIWMSGGGKSGMGSGGNSARKLKRVASGEKGLGSGGGGGW